MKKSNRLINSDSPYLLQHAYNPVDWYPWSEEALQKAKDADRPILVSIGYAACHWCHVMERESFEDATTAAYMNEEFVCIKIDREERPDLDHIYMDAVVAISGSGGWPLNVFLTPDAKPFYGGTYYPPEDAFNKPGWKRLLAYIVSIFKNDRAKVEEQALALTEHIAGGNVFSPAKLAIETKDWRLEKSTIEALENDTLRNKDDVWGGFGKAPKFPQFFILNSLLHSHYYTENDAAINQVKLTLDKILQGGIWDHVGGGLSRYSTDERWLVPHFEKMLYDNALLMITMSRYIIQTGDKALFKYLDKTFEFLNREMKDASGGYYAALDADSEGEEGKFYVWSAADIKNILGEGSTDFMEYYNVSEKGNWEGTNILHTNESIFNSHQKEIEYEAELQKLLEARGSRVRPLTDDKILLGWNALLCRAFCETFAATGNEHYREAAIALDTFIAKQFADDKKGWAHTFKNGVAKEFAFADDLAFYGYALIALQEISGDEKYIDKAVEVMNFLVDNFSDEDELYFYFTSRHQPDAIIRRKDMYDGALPSSNAIIAYNLFYLSYITDNTTWRKRALKMTELMKETVVKYPTSLSAWAENMLIMGNKVPEIVIMGENIHAKISCDLQLKLPFRILQISSKVSDRPLLKGKKPGLEKEIYLCSDGVCSAPVNDVQLIYKMVKK